MMESQTSTICVPDPSAMAVDALSLSWNALWTYA